MRTPQSRQSLDRILRPKRPQIATPLRASTALNRKMLAAGTAGRLSGKGRAARYPTRKRTRRASAVYAISSRFPDSAEPRGRVFHTRRQVAPGRFNALWGSSPRPLTSLRGESGGTSGWIHDLGYLCSAFRRGGLIPNELSLQLSTFLRSLDLFLELRTRTFLRSRLTTNQPRCDGKQGTDGPELSRFHSSTHHPWDKRQARSWDYVPAWHWRISYRLV
jgi:hypothetical protein